MIPARIASPTLWVPLARQGLWREFLGSAWHVPLIRSNRQALPARGSSHPRDYGREHAENKSPRDNCPICRLTGRQVTIRMRYWVSLDGNLRRLRQRLHAAGSRVPVGATPVGGRRYQPSPARDSKNIVLRICGFRNTREFRSQVSRYAAPSRGSDQRDESQTPDATESSIRPTLLRGSWMRKAECEKAIRHLCGVWAGERNLSYNPDDPDFGDFYRWLQSRAPQYLEFRTTEGVRDAVEQWFAQEFRQTWRY